MLKDEYTLQKTAMFFSMLGDSGRIRIIDALLENGEMCVSHLAAAVGASQSGVSHQLRILKDNDIVNYRRDGKNILYALDDEHVQEVLATGIKHIEHKTRGHEQ